MSQERNLLLVAFFTFILGLVFFAWHKSWFVISFQTTGRQEHYLSEHTASKKTITLYFWLDHRWRHDKAEIIVTKYQEDGLQQLVNGWLRLLEQEIPATKHITLQSVALNESATELLISFDRNPFGKQLATLDKLMWIEGLLKTIKEFCPGITHVRFLAHHEPINDPHLDFANTWPIDGFLG